MCWTAALHLRVKLKPKSDDALHRVTWTRRLTERSETLIGVRGDGEVLSDLLPKKMATLVRLELTHLLIEGQTAYLFAHSVKKIGCRMTHGISRSRLSRTTFGLDMAGMTGAGPASFP